MDRGALGNTASGRRNPLDACSDAFSLLGIAGGASLSPRGPRTVEEGQERRGCMVLSWVARLASLALARELKDTYFSFPPSSFPLPPSPSITGPILPKNNSTTVERDLAVRLPISRTSLSQSSVHHRAIHAGDTSNTEAQQQYSLANNRRPPRPPMTTYPLPHLASEAPSRA
jgi:hypothetical protein